MNTKTKRRLVVVTGVIVLVLAVALAVIGSGGAAKTTSVGQAVDGSLTGERVQVSGNVVDNSFTTRDNTLTFDIYDAEGDPSQTLRVIYEGAASSTFGNGVTAICTGTLEERDGGIALVASELVTKCPSKYESATDALSVSRLLDYGADIVDTTVKVSGMVAEGTLAPAGGDERFVLRDSEDASAQVSVAFDGALADAISDGTAVVLTGSLSADGTFAATDVAQEG